MQKQHLWGYTERFPQADYAKTQYLHFLTLKILANP